MRSPRGRTASTMPRRLWMRVTEKLESAFFNRGMGGVETDHGVVRLILLRSITNYTGYYTPEASEAGSHTFEYSLYAHSGDWRNGVVNQAHSFAGPADAPGHRSALGHTAQSQ